MHVLAHLQKSLNKGFSLLNITKCNVFYGILFFVVLAQINLSAKNELSILTLFCTGSHAVFNFHSRILQGLEKICLFWDFRTKMSLPKYENVEKSKIIKILTHPNVHPLYLSHPCPMPNSFHGKKNLLLLSSENPGKEMWTVWWLELHWIFFTLNLTGTFSHKTTRGFLTKNSGLGIRSSLIRSFPHFAQIKWATVSHSLRSLKTN